MNAGIAFLVTYYVALPILFFIGLLLTVVLIGFLILLLVVPARFVVWIWAMVHAYQGAVRWNAERGIVS